MYKLLEILEDLKNTNDDELEAAADLQNLGFDVVPLDDDEYMWYWVMKNGNHSSVSKDIGPILNLAKKYPEKYIDSILKFDNNYWK